MKKLTILFLFLLAVPSFSLAQTVPPTISVEGKAIPTVSFPDNPLTRTASARSGELNGLSSTINAYAVKDITPCNNAKRSTTAPITRLWQHNIDLKDRTSDGGVLMFGMAPNEALTFRFVANYIGTGQVYLDMGNGEAGSPVSQFVSISSNPCDFDVSKVVPVATDYCYADGIPSAAGLMFRIKSKSDTTSSSGPNCVLTEGNTYYLNIRFLDVRPGANDGREKNDACEVDRIYWGQSERRCGGLIKFSGSVSSTQTTTNTTPATTNGLGDIDPNAPSTGSSIPSCMSLTNNFARGTRDAQVNNEVSLLQDFLSPKYLQVEPTGYFGAMTFTAVQAFQRDSGLSATGYVGPLTRAKIKAISCDGASAGSSNTTSNTTQTTNTSNNTSTNQNSNTNNYNNTQSTYSSYTGPTGGFSISSPFSGQALSNNGQCSGGTTQCVVLPPITTIRWSKPNATSVTIDLYDTSGGRVKTIAANTSNTGSYEWRYDPTLSNGRYKVVISTGSQSAESGYFDIGGSGFAPSTVTSTNTNTNTQTNTVTTSGFKAPDVDINGNIILPTEKPSITIEPDARGVQVPFTNLPNNAPLNVLYETVINPEKMNYMFRTFGLDQEQAVTYRVDIPEWMEGIQFRVQANENTFGMDVPRMITLSETRGDFDTVKGTVSGPSQVSANSCYTSLLHPSFTFSTSKNGRTIYEYEDSGTLRNVISKTVFGPGQLDAMKKYTCIVVPGKTYYINVRFTTPSGTPEFKTLDGCAWVRRVNGSQANCGTLVQIVHDGKIDVLKQLAQNGSGVNTSSNTPPPDISITGQTIQEEPGSSSILNGELGLPVSTAGSVATPPLSVLYETAFNFNTANGYFQRRLAFKPNEAFTTRMNVPLSADGTIGRLITEEWTGGAYANSFVSISEKRGDFDTTKLMKQDPNTGKVTGDPCYITGRFPAIQWYVSSTGYYPSKYQNGVETQFKTIESAKQLNCQLIPGKTYYVNLRFQNANITPAVDSCPQMLAYVSSAAGYNISLCGSLFQISYGAPVPLHK